MAFGMLYWLLPRIFQTKLWSTKLAEWHFWVGTVGILLYIVPIYVAGLTQGLMWRAITPTGQLAYPDFVETVKALQPLYWTRVLGGAFYVGGIGMLAVNYFMTWRSRPASYADPVYRAIPLSAQYVDPPEPESDLKDAPVLNSRNRSTSGPSSRGTDAGNVCRSASRSTRRSRSLSRRSSRFIPTFLIRSNVPTISTVKPYTPLELAGRDIYVGEGCYNCHSQMIRPILSETKRYGEYSKPGEFIYDRPFQWGSRRIGPDLAREGGKQSHLWHLMHMIEPTNTTPGSIMPAYAHLADNKLNFKGIPDRVHAAAYLGAPYEKELTDSEAMARAQATQIADDIVKQGGRTGLADKQVVAVIAYLQRMGTDLFAPPPPAGDTVAPSTDAPQMAKSAEEDRDG